MLSFRTRLLLQPHAVPTSSMCVPSTLPQSKMQSQSSEEGGKSQRTSLSWTSKVQYKKNSDFWLWTRNSGFKHWSLAPVSSRLHRVESRFYSNDAKHAGGFMGNPEFAAQTTPTYLYVKLSLKKKKKKDSKGQLELKMNSYFYFKLAYRNFKSNLLCTYLLFWIILNLLCGYYHYYLSKRLHLIIIHMLRVEFLTTVLWNFDKILIKKYMV